MPLQSSQIEETFTCSDDEIKPILSSIIKLNLHNEQNKKIIIGKVNQLIGASKTRTDGLEFLRQILPSCTLEASEIFLKWVQMCMVQPPHDVFKEIKLQTMADIIEYAPKDQEFNKKFVSDYLSKILESCVTAVHTNLYELEVALNCLNTCIKYFASSSLPYKNKIETFVVKLLDCENPRIVEVAGFTFLLLQQVGGAGIEGINHVNNFSLQFKKMCATVHSLFDQLFDDVTEVEAKDVLDVEPFQFIHDAYDVVKLKHINARRINNCLKFIMVMIQKKFPVPKETEPRDLLGIIARGMSIHYCLDKPEISIITCHFSLLLSQVQVQLMQLLRLSLVWYQTYLLPFSYMVSKILLDSINRTQGCNCFTADSIFKEAVYKALMSWINISKGSINEKFQNQLLTSILKDIVPIKAQVVLSMTNTGLSNNAKAKAINQKIISGGHTTHQLTKHQIKIAENCCKLALQTLKTFFSHVQFKADNSVMKETYTTLITLLVDIQTCKIVDPYKNEQCQGLLYEVLVSIYEHKTLTLPAVHIAINLLSHGANVGNRFISATCYHGLSILEKLCESIGSSLDVEQPAAATMDIDLEVQHEESNEQVEDEEIEPVINIEDEDVPRQNSDSPTKVVILSNQILHEKEVEKPIVLDPSPEPSDDDSPNIIPCSIEKELEIVESPCQSLTETQTTTQPLQEYIAKIDDEQIILIDSPPPAKKQKTDEDEENIDLDDVGFVDQIVEY